MLVEEVLRQEGERWGGEEGAALWRRVEEVRGRRGWWREGEDGNHVQEQEQKAMVAEKHIVIFLEL